MLVVSMFLDRTLVTSYVFSTNVVHVALCFVHDTLKFLYCPFCYLVLAAFLKQFYLFLSFNILHNIFAINGL